MSVKWDNLYWAQKPGDMFAPDEILVSYPTGPDYKKRDTISVTSMDAALQIKRTQLRNVMLDLAKRFVRGYENSMMFTTAGHNAGILNAVASLKQGIQIAEKAGQRSFPICFDKDVCKYIAMLKRGPHSKFHNSDKEYNQSLLNLSKQYADALPKVAQA